MRLLLFLAILAGSAAPGQAADSGLEAKVAAAVGAARSSDHGAFADLVDANAKLDVYKRDITSATMDGIREAFDGCTAQPSAGSDPVDQVTQLWDCKGAPTLAAFNFKNGKIVLVRTLPNFRPIAPPSTERR